MFFGALSRETEAAVAQQMHACYITRAGPVRSLVGEMTVDSANYSGRCFVLKEGSDGSSWSPKAQGDFLEKLKEEVVFQVSLKGEKVFKVEKDMIGSPGMA